MKTSEETSPYYDAWVSSTADDYEAALSAIAERDFEQLAELSESSCLKMHGVMQSSLPAMIYWRPATLSCIHAVRELRSSGTPVFFTIDAGPQVKAVCLPDAVDQVANELAAIPGVISTHTVGLGAGLDYTANKWLFEARGWWVKGTVEQLTRNPGTPLDLANPGETAYVALGYDFPDQENEQILAELKLTHEVSDNVSVGAFYWLDVFNLSDFMVDGMDPYGENFLSVDDATRFMYLNARYADYTANVLQAFLKVTF